MLHFLVFRKNGQAAGFFCLFFFFERKGDAGGGTMFIVAVTQVMTGTSLSC